MLFQTNMVRTAKESKGKQKKAERIGALVDAYRSGALSYSRLADRIDEVLNGEFDRIVRVGEVPKPEIKS